MSNYRPISLLNSFSKNLWKSSANYRLLDHLIKMWYFNQRTVWIQNRINNSKCYV